MNKAYRGKCRVTRHEKAAEDVFELCIAAPGIAGAATPGQFVNVYLSGGDMLLPRPLSIADCRGSEIKLMYAVTGKGTERLSGILEGESVEVMGPLGTGFFDYPGCPMYTGAAEKDAGKGAAEESAAGKDVDKKGKNPFAVLLIGGGVGLAPLHFAARRLRERLGEGVWIEAFLGFRGQPWHTFEVERFCDEAGYAAEAFFPGAFHGNVMEMLEKAYPEGLKADLALACGPRPMMAAAAGWCAARRIPLRVSLEERMGCGYGACAGCTARTRPLDDGSKPQNGPTAPDAEGIIRKKVCVHGPVFWADEVVWQ